MNMCRVTGPVGSVAVAAAVAAAEADGAGWEPPLHAETMNAKVAAIATGLILILFPPPCGPIYGGPLRGLDTPPSVSLRRRLSSRVRAARELGDRRRERVDICRGAHEHVDDRRRTVPPTGA